MRFKIIHETEYEFSKSVFLEPHYLMFKPKNAPHLELESHLLKLSITPAGISEQLDAEENFVHFCWFDGMHDKINIISEAIVNSNEYNPFNFLIYPLYFNTVPFSYSDNLVVLLQRYLTAETINEQLLQYGKTILASKNNATLPFLTELTISIHADFIVESREEGIPFEPHMTFQLKKGSCRDLVWMQIHLLRNLGIASRFVSGYYYVDVEDPQYELHAWTEVFLPGAGWIGFDPSNGITTSHTHIAVASSSHYVNTMPVSGTLRGDATSELKTTLVIEVLD
ncbi:transglutaminase family protein [Maribacter halichondriae]|uniref:transglutaminase family protein n=1 Tax=Maribacter halichondriae TaxID=2980554 RepID=UPI00235901F3|nr:transglutaminase family protein [Maribacter sp. Hal144]